MSRDLSCSSTSLFVWCFLYSRWQCVRRLKQISISLWLPPKTTLSVRSGFRLLKNSVVLMQPETSAYRFYCLTLCEWYSQWPHWRCILVSTSRDEIIPFTHFPQQGWSWHTSGATGTWTPPYKVTCHWTEMPSSNSSSLAYSIPSLLYRL